MKFRYKVLVINIILLSIGIGTVGFLMIDKNYKLALDSQIRNAIMENNIIQSTIEYNLLDSIGNNNRLDTQIADIGENLALNSATVGSSIYLVYDGRLLYSNSTDLQRYPDSLWQESEIGKKNYIIVKENQRSYIYVTSCSSVNEKNLNVINKMDITPLYELVKKQEQYYNILLISVISFCSILMFIASYLLTKPLEKLNRVSESFGKGDYSMRASINTKDEIGELATTYNHMAESVENHVEELNQMIVRQEQFVADFTHEIKTPMTSIIGYADTLRSIELSRENQIMAASYIFSEGKRLEAMSMKLFEFIYTKQHSITKKPIHLSGLMHDIEQSVIPSLKQKNIALTVDVRDCIIDGDKDLLKSAFINIIDNARKASPENSTIVFSSELVSDGVLIKVSDQGIGISEEHLSRICDEFYMVDKSRSRKEGGAGLGLSLASLIFKAHDAIFNIESKLNVGTTMMITFTEYKEIEQKEDDYE